MATRKRAYIPPDIQENLEKPGKYLTKFKPFGTMCDDLRRHVISYCRNKLNYSICSKLCNAEIQRYNIVAPTQITLNRSRHSAIRVILDYQNGSSESVCENGKITEYLQRCHQYVRGGSEAKIIYVNKWAADIPDSDIIRRIKIWEVIVTSSNYNDMVEYFNNNSNIQWLRLNSNAAKFTMPSSFFKSTAFRNIPRFNFGDIYARITDDDFLGTKATKIKARGVRISEMGMHQKIQQWFNGTSTEEIDFEFWEVVRKNGIHTNGIRGYLPFTNAFYVGTNQITSEIVRADGKRAVLYVSQSTKTISFYTK